MAKPRIFISSTYYDLKQTREDIANFLSSLGYEPVRNEEGSIAYGSEKELQEYCYKEIHNVDILISIIGGRFGSEANDKQWSVSNKELLTALEDEKQVYIFIDKNVASEFRTYQKNRNIENIEFCYVDNPKIYEFVEKVNSLKRNNNIKTFETSADIQQYLKEQLAGLFHSLMEEKAKYREINLTNKLIASTKSLEELVQLLINANKNNADEVKIMLKTNHPAVRRISELLDLKFGVWIDSFEMLSKLLASYDWVLQSNNSETGMLEWKKERLFDKTLLFQVSSEIFNPDNSLREFTQKEWKDSYISITEQDDRSDANLPF